MSGVMIFPHSLSPQALLFDMDGTLVDSTAVVERTWQDFADRHGLDVNEILANAHGRRTEETIARYAPEGIDLLAETRRVVAQEVYDVDGIVPVAGAASLLRQLPPNRWALVTSAGRELATRRMTAAGLSLPAVVITADDVTVGKPDPESYLAAAKALDVPIAETVIFEDSEAGLESAVAAGGTPIVVGGLTGPATSGRLQVPDLNAVTIEKRAGLLGVTLIPNGRKTG
jgi:HAD superfamily hydrolase (TIGR01509 family)